LRKIKVVTIFGTRPEAIKMAPVVHELGRRTSFEVVVAVTAQHREMLDSVLRHFSIRPAYDLGIMRQRQDLNNTMARALRGLGRVLVSEKPDLVLVHGDTLTTMAGALSAFFHGIGVGHVEAGLRTWDKRAPFPEEMMRRLTDDMADVFFPPTYWSRSNLLREGAPPERVFVTGNTAIDALLMTVSDDYRFAHPGLDRMVEGVVENARRTSPGARFILVEVHRRENLGAPLERICRGLRRVAEDRTDVRLIVSVHRNPAVKSVIHRVLRGQPRVHLFEPFDYADWANLMKRCHLIVTDSGGLQEEAPALGIPVLLAREKTERPEAIEAGTVRLVGSDPDGLYLWITRLLDDPEEYRKMSKAVNPYGDGSASRRIADALEYVFGLRNERPEDFGCVCGTSLPAGGERV